MPAPSYTPLGGGSSQLPSGPGGRPLTQEEYMQWLQSRGSGNPYAPAQQQASPDYSKALSSLAEAGGLKSAAGIGGGAAQAAGAPVLTSTLGSGSMAATTIPAGAAVPAGYTAVGSAANGSVMVAPTSSIGGAGGGAFSLGGIGSAGNVILPAAGLLGSYDVLSHNYGPGRGALEGAASGAAIGSYFGPTGALVGGGIGGVVGGVKGFMKHETTREHARKDTEAMKSKFKDDATYQAYVNGMRAQYDAPPPDPKHPFHAGQYATWDEYKKAGLDSGDLTGVKGNIDTFGADWTHLNEGQRKAVTQKLIDAGLYDSKRGEVEVTDPTKAKQIYADMAKGGFKIPVASASAPGSAGTAGTAGAGTTKYPRSAPENKDTWVGQLPNQKIVPSGGMSSLIGKTPTGSMPPEMSKLLNGVQIPKSPPANWNQAPLPNGATPWLGQQPSNMNRSQTRSPGIDKNGNRINYGKR